VDTYKIKRYARERLRDGTPRWVTELPAIEEEI